MQIHQNIEDIVHHALLVKKLKDAFSDLTTAKKFDSEPSHILSIQD